MKRKTHEEYVQELSIKRPNIIVLGQYVNSRTKILVKCKICDYEWEVVPNTLVSTNSGCPRCANHEPLNTETFIKKAELKNTKIKVLGGYVNYKKKVKVQCGKIYDVMASSVLKGVQCIDCYKQSLRGEGHPRWNSNLTQEDREIGRHYPEYHRWISEVRGRDANICWVTGIKDYKNTDVHHIDGYNWCKEKRTDINNGITLSKEIHKEFHDMFGRGNNTRQQFIEFLHYKKSTNSISEDKYTKLLQFLLV